MRNNNEIGIPDSFSEIILSRNLQNQPRNHTTAQNSKNIPKKAEMYKESKNTSIRDPMAPIKVRNPNRKIQWEREWDAQKEEISLIKKKYFFGLNYFSWCSQLRTFLEILVEISCCVFLIIFLMKKDLKIFKILSFVVLVKHGILVFDFLYTFVKKQLFVSDLIFGIFNFLYWVRFFTFKRKKNSIEFFFPEIFKGDFDFFYRKILI